MDHKDAYIALCKTATSLGRGQADLVKTEDINQILIKLRTLEKHINSPLFCLTHLAQTGAYNDMRTLFQKTPTEELKLFFSNATYFFDHDTWIFILNLVEKRNNDIPLSYQSDEIRRVVLHTDNPILFIQSLKAKTHYIFRDYVGHILLNFSDTSYLKSLELMEATFPFQKETLDDVFYLTTQETPQTINIKRLLAWHFHRKRLFPTLPGLSAHAHIALHEIITTSPTDLIQCRDLIIQKNN